MYLKEKKEYKKLCEIKQKEWGDKWTEDLNLTLSDKTGKAFWKKIQSLKQRHQKTNQISSPEWEKYFKSIFQFQGDRDESRGVRKEEESVNLEEGYNEELSKDIARYIHTYLNGVNYILWFCR